LALSYFYEIARFSWINHQYIEDITRRRELRYDFYLRVVKTLESLANTRATAIWSSTIALILKDKGECKLHGLKGRTIRKVMGGGGGGGGKSKNKNRVLKKKIRVETSQ
jgi:hypothetical protein